MTNDQTESFDHSGQHLKPKPAASASDGVGVAGKGLVLVLATVVPTGRVGAGFVWDDDTHITENQALRSPGGLWAIWFQPGRPASIIR